MNHLASMSLSDVLTGGVSRRHAGGGQRRSRGGHPATSFRGKSPESGPPELAGILLNGWACVTHTFVATAVLAALVVPRHRPRQDRAAAAIARGDGGGGAPAHRHERRTPAAAAAAATGSATAPAGSATAARAARRRPARAARAEPAASAERTGADRAAGRQRPARSSAARSSRAQQPRRAPAAGRHAARAQGNDGTRAVARSDGRYDNGRYAASTATPCRAPARCRATATATTASTCSRASNYYVYGYPSYRYYVSRSLLRYRVPLLRVSLLRPGLRGRLLLEQPRVAVALLLLRLELRLRPRQAAARHRPARRRGLHRRLLRRRRRRLRRRSCRACGSRPGNYRVQVALPGFAAARVRRPHHAGTHHDLSRRTHSRAVTLLGVTRDVEGGLRTARRWSGARRRPDAQGGESPGWRPPPFVVLGGWDATLRVA